MASFVLQTPLFETPIGEIIAKVLKLAITEWGLERKNHIIPHYEFIMHGISELKSESELLYVAVREAHMLN